MAMSRRVLCAGCIVAGAILCACIALHWMGVNGSELQGRAICASVEADGTFAIDGVTCSDRDDFISRIPDRFGFAGTIRIRSRAPTASGLRDVIHALAAIGYDRFAFRTLSGNEVLVYNCVDNVGRYFSAGKMSVAYILTRQKFFQAFPRDFNHSPFRSPPRLNELYDVDCRDCLTESIGERLSGSNLSGVVVELTCGAQVPAERLEVALDELSAVGGKDIILCFFNEPCRLPWQ